MNTSLWDTLCFDVQEIILKKKEELENNAIAEWRKSMIYTYDKVDEWKIERYVHQKRYEQECDLEEVNDLMNEFDRFKCEELSSSDFRLYKLEVMEITVVSDKSNNDFVNTVLSNDWMY